MKLENFIQELSSKGVQEDTMIGLLDHPEPSTGDPDALTNGDSFDLSELTRSTVSNEKGIGISKTKGLFGKIGTTKFRSLQYGKGEKPLVVNKIPDLDSDRTDPEAFSRVIRPITARKDDLIRITKLLIKPGGVRWEAHQAELQTLQNQLESKREVQNISSNLMGLLKSAGQSLLKTAVGLTPSTLIQVGVAGTGEHQTPYSDRAYLKKGNTSKASGILGFLTTVGSYVGILPSATLVDGANFAKSGKPIPIDGTDSRLADTDYSNDTLYKKNLLLSTEVRPGKQIKSDDPVNVVNYTETRTGKSYHAEATIPNQTYEEKWLKTTYNREHSPLTKKNTEINPPSESRYTDKGGPYTGTGSVAKVVFGTDGKPVKKDISAKQVYLWPEASKGNGAQDLFGSFYENSLEGNGIDGINNLIPFRIVAITPEWMYPLSFEANLESYNDNYNADWSEVRYIGRGEKYWTYTGFDRDISFSFNALAHNKGQLESLYRNLNMLAGTTAPTYDTSGVFMRGTFVSVTIGELLYDQLGFFKSVSFKWDKDIMWEIDDTLTTGYAEGEDKTTAKRNFGGHAIRVPHMLTVDVTFKPIHSFVPTLDNPYQNRYYFGMRHPSTGSSDIKREPDNTTGNTTTTNMETQGAPSKDSSNTGNPPVYKDSSTGGFKD